MKKLIILNLFCLVLFTNVYSQQTLMRTSDSFIFGEFNDTLFEGVFHNTIIKMNPNTSEMKIVLLNDQIESNNPTVDSIFNKLKSSITIEVTIDPTSYIDQENVVDNKIYSGTALVTINGIVHSLQCEYAIQIIKTDNPYLKDMKLSFNVLIPIHEFEINLSNKLSEEIEIEINNGLINQ